jgi:hypothetical protein|tara:strand:- start:16417 stop:17595 length:1179 start_codon:yes stop_codon:yes gene_type:complete
MEFKNIDVLDKSVQHEILPYGNLNPLVLGFNQIMLDNIRFTSIQRNPNNGRPFSNLYPAFGLPTANFEILGWDIDWGNTSLMSMDSVSTAIAVEYPKNSYGELIDGRSIRLSIPVNLGSGSTIMECYSSYFAGYNASSDPSNEAEAFGHTSALNYTPPVPNPGVADLSTNVSFLFSDDIKPPVNGGSWKDGWSQAQTPEGYDEGSSTVMNFNNGKAIAESIDSGSGKDVPIGICYLDKGFCVLTHSGVTNTFEWTGGTSLSTGNAFTGHTSAATQVYFSSPLVESTFYSFEKQWVLSILCKAEANEFYLTQNTTAADLNPEVRTGLVVVGSGNPNMLGPGTFYDLNSVNKATYITEVALYDDDGHMLAIAKPDRPVKKLTSEPAYFNLKFRF